MVQFVKVFSLAVALGLSLVPGHHQPATGSVAATSQQLRARVVEQPRPDSLKLDGASSRTWTAVQAALQAQLDAEKAKEAADAAAAEAASQAAAQAAAAQATANQAARVPAAVAAPMPAPAANPGVAAVQAMIRQAFAPLGQAAVDWGLRVAACESGYNPNAYNPDGASGVFQFMPGTFRATPYGNQNIFDASANVNAAAWKYGRDGGSAWSCK